ncbi:hypothetical protein KI387_039217, partial [Taxus chinensis]
MARKYRDVSCAFRRRKPPLQRGREEYNAFTTELNSQYEYGHYNLGSNDTDLYSCWNSNNTDFSLPARLPHYCSIGVAGSLEFLTGAKEAAIPFERNSVRSNVMDSTQESSRSFSNGLLLSAGDNGYCNNPYSHGYAKSWLFNQSIEKDTP